MADSRDVTGKGALPNPGSTSSTLLDRLRLGDAEAWDRMVNLYYQWVFDWCRLRLHQEEDAAEVAQEVFTGVLQSLPRFRRDRPGDSFRGWIYRIICHKIQDFWRRQEKQPVPEGGTDASRRLAQVVQEPAEDEEVPADARALLVRRALDVIRHEFDEQTVEAFWRQAVEGHSPADIASDMGITVNKVYKAKSRILARLRAELGDLLE
jgi:RNA polymerase sigma-70 factor, ECF subfamily